MVVLVFVAGMAAVVVGCRSTDLRAPIDGELLIGQGGGFTGLYSGYVLRADGVVYRWSQMPGQPERVEEAGRVPADSVQPFLQQMAAWEAEGVTLSGASNMTAFAELRHAGKRYRLQWGVDEDIPTAVRAWYAEVLQFLRRHLP